MRKVIYIACIIILVGLIGVISWFSYSSEPRKIAATQITQTVEQVRSSTPSPTPAAPVELRIPSLNLTAAVESVGLDEKGNMDVPKEDKNVGWYNLGYKPGETGSSVIAGHLDTKEGTPAVFYELSTVKAGDEIFVVDANSTTHTYTVESIKTYEFDDLPLTEIFAGTTPKLHLITCEGTFDDTSNNYSKRLVVTATFVE